MGPASHRHTISEEQPARVDCWGLTRSLEDERFLFLLDSAGDKRELGRYSILAWRPRWEFLAKDGVARAGAPGAAQPLGGSVLVELERTLAAFSATAGCVSGQTDAPPVFKGGAVGYLAYELLHEIEAVELSAAPDLGVADCHLLFCDLALVTDEIAGRSWIVSNGWGATDADSRAECLATLEMARGACASAEPIERPRPPLELPGSRLRGEDLERYGIRAVTTRERYLDLVQRAREHIFAGDVFELCLAQRFDTDFDGRGVDLYEAMRAITPAPMAAYLRYPGLEVLSCSPERFLRVDAGRWVQTRPIKGTRPRGRDALEDEALAIDLANAPKDGAENVMIVDVARNDLGRVCEFGTITVPALRVVERHPSVLQLVSTVRGRLRADTTPVELLAAAFPGASVTGAPKIEAMRLISGMEDSRRGVFSGAIGYINYSGELDLNIVIRTIVKRGEALSFHTGGAVTSDSTPAAEYQETLDKACALVKAIEGARASAKAIEGAKASVKAIEGARASVKAIEGARASVKAIEGAKASVKASVAVG